MKAKPERRRTRGEREVRMIVPNARSKVVRRQVAKEVLAMDPLIERQALRWIESVAEFDRK